MRISRLLIGIIIGSVFISGCQKENTEEEVASQKAEAIAVELPKNTYEFLDVEGNSYEAELLENVPQHKYDYSRIIDENGFKYYFKTYELLCRKHSKSIWRIYCT